VVCQSFSVMTVHHVLSVSPLLVPNSDCLSRVPEFGEGIGFTDT
jgi:hypothetical protein